MTTLTPEIIFTLSGGNFNSNPDKSLGGDPSNIQISNGRLFNDISQTDSIKGITDYRCFYLNNISNLHTLYAAKLSVNYNESGETLANLGFIFQNEKQNIEIQQANLVTNGSFTLTYIDVDGNHDMEISWNNDINILTNNIATAIQQINNLTDVTISNSISNNNYIFEINFQGSAGNRFHDTIIIKNNNLTPVTTIVLAKVVSGSPINSIAGLIDVSTTLPANVVFSNSQEVIGEIRPLDSIPIWVQRYAPANSANIQGDGFTLKINCEVVIS